MEARYNKQRFSDGNTYSKFRVILIGDAYVGKTSLIMRYMNNNFRDEYFPTKEIMYFIFIYNIYFTL